MMHDAFDDIPPRVTFNVSTVLAVHPTRLAVSPMSMNPESWKCPKESNVPACVTSACHSNTIETDLEPT